MEDKNNAIEVRGLYKSFKISYDKPQTLKERLLFWNRDKVEHKLILKNISLNIKKGETVALVGTNGSGKSTLLKLMTKILYPNKGKLETQGKLTSLLELGAGFHPDFTGRENIYFNASIFGLTRKEIDARIEDIIAFSELEEFIDNPVRTYSSGMYMRLAFSIAINVDADILLIDEILAVGDQHFQERCFDKLTELGESDKTIVFVSHDLGSVEKLCDRAIWIYKGELKADGDPTYVIEQYLDQISIDHQEKRKEGIKKADTMKKRNTYNGVGFIDVPKGYQEVNNDLNHAVFEGWELNEHPQSRIRVEIDGNSLDVKRKDRPDVFVVYDGLYGGFEANDKAGWEVEVDVTKLNPGEHKITLITETPEGQLITKEENVFRVVEVSK
ncbi:MULTISPECIES: ABC transporter ATP-binding protein [unclassified Breznakia]|uniref:ABC transporter ATP-binding protein n=1 Tax=unclassified Breznakia TaxID=2623764 RepID=UPI0024736415|nr:MULTISPECIES: ABC transporter ATP-binding protein [unclassified Breznakia]MDH6367906.1 ABC-type polysaccharide/polyol phosphate transport system ATPase subunit [Breznakia sp. PH1-1]MDH6404994.1 ABC-type polysaccharide/polyol phosphate transport system ATPase subunit [Breznakia sp. PF1-11]MDH6412695.1 ABC-type polysaccharide/polyol phosphate transport system ATPase subunit [Breznakia sp. PFB1-11]MDH6415069.1 ABC-type polysaccharide/polyol phosphate transport system ATPase subunit [Breznakia s